MPPPNPSDESLKIETKLATPSSQGKPNKPKRRINYEIIYRVY